MAFVPMRGTSFGCGLSMARSHRPAYGGSRVEGGRSRWLNAQEKRRSGACGVDGVHAQIAGDDCAQRRLIPWATWASVVSWNLTSELSRSEQSGAQKYKILPLVLRVLSGFSTGGPIGALPNTGQDFVFLYSLKSKKNIYEVN